MIHRRSLLAAIPALGFTAVAGPARAQAYPSRPIRIVVPFLAGGTVDIVARVIGQQVSADLGQPVVIDNRPGGGTTIALKAVATQLGTEVSINFGSSLAGLVLPVVGAFVVVAVRQLVMAVALVPFYRPKRAEFTWRRLRPAVALGVVLAIMNVTFYESIDRLGLGIAATIEFLGPLSIALFTSRRVLDVACAIAAGVGVLLLVRS